MDIKKTAADIFKAIKEQTKMARDARRNNPYADGQVNFYVSSMYDMKAGKYLDYIEIRGKQFGGMDGMRDVQAISNEVVRLLDEQKKVRGWGNLVYTTTDLYEGVGIYNQRKYTILDKIALPENPCKEFKALQTYLKKYGNCTLPDFKLYSAAMGGKRGRLWDEYGERRYLANKPSKCERVLSELRQVRGCKGCRVLQVRQRGLH